MNAYRSLLVLCLSLVLWGCNQQTEPVSDATPASVTENTSPNTAEPQTDPPATDPVDKNADSTPVDKMKPGQSPPVAPPESNDLSSFGAPAGLPTPDPEISKLLTKVYEEASVFGNARNEFKEIALAFHNYHDTYSHFPAAGGSGEAGKTGLSWRVYLLPFLDQMTLYNQFHLDEAWDSVHNKTLISEMPAIYGSNPEGKTSVHVFAGENTPFSSEKGLRIRDVIDGTTNTILCVQAGDDKADIWTKPGGLSVDAENPKASLGKVKESFLVAMMDGSVRELKSDARYLAQLIQHNDGQSIAAEFHDRGPASNYAKPALELTELPPTQPMSTEFDAKFIPDNALLAGVIYPRLLHEHPLVMETADQSNWTKQSAKEFLWNEMLKGIYQGAEETGFRADAIDEIRLVLTPVGPDEKVEMPAPTNTPPVHFAVYMHSAIPLNIETITKSLLNNSAPEKLNVEGYTCLHNEQKMMAFTFLSSNDFLIADQPSTLQAMLKSKQTGAIANQLKTNGSRMAQIAGDIPQDLVSGFSQSIQQQFPPAMIAMLYVREARNLMLALDLDHEELLAVDVKMSNSNNATKLATLTSTQLDSGRQMLETQKQALELSGSKDLLQILDETLTKASVNSEEELVKIRISRPENLSDLPTAMKPILQTARKAAMQAKHKNEFKQIGLAFHNFHDTHTAMPSLDGAPAAPEDKRGLSWRVHLLPFLGEISLYNEFHLDEPWDSEHNKALFSKMPEIFGSNPEGKTRIHLLTGNGAPFKNGTGLKFREITDGMSNTILAIEAGEETAAIWTKPGGLEFDSKEPMKCLGKLDPEQKGILVLLMDGSVRTLATTIDPDVFRRMVQYADGEPVDF